jgi:hypothetical protein
VTKLNYIFMVLKEHPYRREMLRQLLAAGFEPKAMVEEDSSAGDEERAKFLMRMGQASSAILCHTITRGSRGSCSRG